MGGYGVALEKLQATFEFKSSPLFSERERVALRVAARAAMVPTAVVGSTDRMTHWQPHWRIFPGSLQKKPGGKGVEGRQTQLVACSLEPAIIFSTPGKESWDEWAPRVL